MNLTLLFIIGIGGFIGAVLRYVIASTIQSSSGLMFPVGTLSVNVLGSFLIGFAAMFFAQMVEPEYKAFIVTGILGALTTFSTFSWENIMMLQAGDYVKAGLNIFLNITLTLAATLFSIMLFKKIYY